MTTWTGQVGNDNSKDLYYATKKVRVAAGETYVFTLTNFNDKDGSNTWHNWVVEGNSGVKFFDCCANGDNWPFGDGAPTPNYTPVMATTDVENWMTAYNGATVTITVARDAAGTGITITHTSNVKGTTEGNTDKYYGGTYTVTVGAAEEWDIYLTQRLSHFDVTNVVYTEADETSHTYASAIEALPFSRTWTAQSSTYPFVGGDVVSGKYVQAFHVSNTTATASFDSDAGTAGNQPYTLSTDETVTVSFTAFWGWVSGSTTSTVQLLNSEDVALASFTYTQGTSNVTDVSFGGTTVAGFEAFKGRSSHTTANKEANGFASSCYQFVAAAGYNPVITMTVSDNGYVSLRFYTANGYCAVDKNYNTTLPTSGDGAVKMDIASIKIVDGNSNSDRAIGINNLSITSAIAPKANVTFAYADTDDNSLAAVKENYVLENVAVGANIADIIPDALKETFYNGDESYKYVYSTYASSDTEVQEGGSTITLKFDARAKYAFTAKAKDGEENDLGVVASGYGYANEETKFYIPACVLNAGKLYFTTAEDYEKSETLTNNGQVLTYAYTTSTVDNVVFFVEGEDISGATLTTPSNNQQLASKGVLGRGSDLTVANLPTGVYTIYVKYCNYNGSAQNLLVKAGDVNLISEDVSVRPTKNADFTLLTSTNVTLTAAGSSISGVDYIYIVRTGDATVSATLGANGYATFASAYPLDLTTDNLPSGVTAYKAAVSGTTVTFTPLNQTVPANTGVLLKGPEGAEVSIPVATSGTDVTENAFLVNTAGTTFAADDGYTYFGMMKAASSSDAIIFGTFDPSSVAIPANKAYLKVASGSAPSLTFIFDDGQTTGIESVKAEGLMVNGSAEYYNLAGQRVAQPTKGLYIVNGRKVVVK